jgi:hypothetical protein
MLVLVEYAAESVGFSYVEAGDLAGADKSSALVMVLITISGRTQHLHQHR